ncbi:MAG: AAA-like domain-containing protein, partial [Phormidesmis sp.]
PTESGLFRDHLRRHLLNLEANPALVEGFQQVIQSSRPVQIGSTEAFKLHSMGLVKYQGNEVVPLCGLYRQYFKSRLNN